ncbi:hypothetical protein ACHAXA_000622 [Cyclostephanos tholiformis]|uniref:Uncharacterized protein n=1 Tax=Cyclostephanos tholiformis TaxID=382380 RepID=A0ABD3SR12_9STRA
MPLRCGDLSNVDDDAHKAVRTTKDGRRRQGSTSSLNKRTRKPRTESAFRSILPPGGRNDRDPLSLVGSEFLLRGGENRPHRDHPLAALERGDAYKSPRHSPRYCPAGRRRGELIHDHNMSPSNQQWRPADGIGTGGRIRGDLAISTSSSSLTDNTPRRNESCHSLQQRKVRQEIIQSIHGTSGPCPTCPNCNGELTYIYVSSAAKRKHRDDNQSTSALHVSAIEIHKGVECTKYKLRHLLPPVCEKCRTHLLYEGTEIQYLLMENFNKWVDGCRGESDSEDEGDVDDCRSQHGGDKNANGNAGAYDFNDPRNAKIVVVSRPSTPLPQHQSGPTPRQGNSCHSKRRSTFHECDDNDDRGTTLTDDQLSTFSIGTNRPYRRKGPLNYERNPNVMTGDNMERGKQTINKEQDEKRQDEATESGDADVTRVFDGKYFSFDDDPFASDDSGNGREGIQLIRTASEERMILEHYLMKREIATKEIARDLLRGHELLSYKCERCNMPMTQNRDGEAPIDCVTCLGVKRKAKKVAKQKRKKIEIPKHEISSSAATHLAADVFITVRECVSMSQKAGKDLESLTVLDETRNANALVEGPMGFTSSGRNSPVRLETISYGSFGCGNRSSSSSVGLNALHDELRPKESAIAQQSDYLVPDKLTSASQLGRATSFQSYNSSSQDRHPEVECSLSSYNANVCQRNQPKLLQSFSSQFQALATEGNDSSEVSSTRCPRNLSPSEQLYHSNGDMYQKSTSEVTELQHISTMSDTPLFKGVPPCEMIQQSHEHTSTARDDRVSNGDSNLDSEVILEVANKGRSSFDEPCAQIQQPNEMIESAVRSYRRDVNTIQGAISGVSDCRISPSAAKCRDISGIPYTEIAPFQNQKNAVDLSDVLSCQILDYQNQINCSASSEISPTRCPRDLPSHEMTWQYEKRDEIIRCSRGSDAVADSLQEVPYQPSFSELVDNGQPMIANRLERTSGSDIVEDLSQEVSDQPPLKNDNTTNFIHELVDNDQPTNSNSLERRNGDDGDSISKGINRLANSLREVADQLPQHNKLIAGARTDLVENSRQMGSNSLDRKICESQPFYPSQHVSNLINFHDVEESSEQGIHINNISSVYPIPSSTVNKSNSERKFTQSSSPEVLHAEISHASEGIHVKNISNVSPIPSSTVNKSNSEKKFTQSSSPKVLHAEISHAVAMSNSAQLLITLNMFSPIAAVEESKQVHFFRNVRDKNTARTQPETKPKALHLYDRSSPSVSRADPPGCKIDYCERVGRDPPDEASYSALINRGDSHNSAIVIGGIEISTAAGEWATPRRTNIQAKHGRDAPSEVFVSDRAHLSRSIRKSITPETKGKKTNIGNNCPSAQSSISTNSSLLSIGGRNHSSHSCANEKNQTKLHPFSKSLQVSCEINSPHRDPPTEKFEYGPLMSSHSIRMSVTPKTKGSSTYADTSYLFDKGRTYSNHHPNLKLSQGQGSSLGGLSSDSDEIDASLQTAKSWGDSSMDLLFKRIDEIEDDFISVVTSLPSSDGQSLLGLRGENESLKSIKNKHSLVEIIVNKSESFESDASPGSSMVTDAVERMRHIKAYIEKIESVDDGSDSEGYNPHDEMSELINRLTSAADSLRELNEWED